MKRVGGSLLLVIAAALLVSANGTGQGDLRGDARVISPLGEGFSLPVVELDFDLLPSGSVTVGDIQAAFPTAALANITLTPPTAEEGRLEINLCGRSLASDPDGSLRPFMVDTPDSRFSAMGVMVVELAGDTYEAGILVGNWQGPFNVEVFDDGASVGSHTFDEPGSYPGGGSAFRFQSGLPFDEIHFTANPQFPEADWVACSIWLPESAPVMPKGAYGLLGLLLAAVSAFFLTRRG